MMQNISVVIMCRNEQDVIAETIEAALLLSPNIIVVDTGSTDGTLQILSKYAIQIINAEWLGFGPTKNIGIKASKTDWILSVDADEKIDSTLIDSIKNCDLSNQIIVYNIEFLNYLHTTPLQYGEWSGDYHIRLFNRKNVQWNNAEVHEELVFINKPTIKKLKGFIHHKTAKNREELHKKLDNYAKLNAQHYFNIGKKNSALKMYFSTLFNFIKNYFFKLGFLDGKAGWTVAIENAKYTYKKYLYLQQIKTKSID